MAEEMQNESLQSGTPVFGNAASDSEYTANNEFSSIIEQADLLVNNEKLEQANQLYNKALESCNENDDVIKVTLLYKIGLNLANLNKYDDAMSSWDQAIQILDKNNDVYGKGLMLHNIGTTMAKLGNISFATKLWNQSLEFKENAGDFMGMAATLLNLAWVANNQQDFEQEIKLIRQSVFLLAKINAWPELIMTMQKLADTDKENSASILAQVFWLSIYENTEPDTVFFIVSDLLKSLGIENEYAPMIAAGAMFLIESRIHDHPQKQAIQNAAKEIMAGCAIVRKIPENEISDWINNQGLNEPIKIFNELQISLNNIVGENNWLFDRSLFKDNL